MKKIFVIAAIALFGFNNNIMAQWEKPTEQTQQTEQKEKRGIFDRNKSSKPMDKKYLQGGVPEVDGKVTFTKTISAPGKTADQLYESLLSYFQQFVKADGQLQNSQVAVVNKADHQIGVRAIEWLVFENKALSLDRTKMNYTIVVDCKNGSADLKITNISYKYEEDRPTAISMTAEEWITDKEAINKKGDGLRRGMKKFRVKTIDRVDNIFTGVADYLK